MTANFASGTVWTGDNLAVMRGMNSGCVDLIYLDPPFNSNRHYEAPIGSKAAGAAFKDAWTLDDVDVHEHGELADRNPAAYCVIEAARTAHGKSMQSYLIFMAVRLLEMRRLLKPTGSIYLHCDPTASHYIKIMMDAMFGARNYKNEIVWRRTNAHNVRTKMFPRVHDTILFYTKSEDHVWHKSFQDYSPEQLKRYKEDEDGRLFTGQDLTMMGGSEDRKVGWRGTKPADNRAWRASLEQREEWWSQGLILTKKDGTPRLDGRKVFLDEKPGKVSDTIWTDILRVGNTAQERLGYPTQKPLALLDRIIKASSNPGDMVLDPFCGCATALVAADRLQREWAGIDLSPLAIKLVDDRIAADRANKKGGEHIGGNLWGGATALTEPPQRTDLGDLPKYRTHRHRLYGEQEGVCVGCETHFPFRVMDVDHILPRIKGGTDHPDNLQLLCSGCNRSKGGRTMAEWRAAT